MNPILQALNSTTRQPSNALNLLKNIKNPEAMFQQMLNSNPQFRSFVEANKGKSAEQIAQEHGIDLGLLNSLLK